MPTVSGVFGQWMVTKSARDNAASRSATASHPAACSNCNLKGLCLPVGLAPDELERLDTLVTTRRKIRRGETLFRRGESFASIYAVRSGFFKTTISSEDGRDQVTGFQMTGGQAAIKKRGGSPVILERLAKRGELCGMLRQIDRQCFIILF